jgi:hypothetical protein
MYVLRRSASSVSAALYVPERNNISVRLIETQSDDQCSPRKAAFIQIGNEDSLKNGEQLTYRQLVELVCTAEKVVTL